ncbi:MAG: PIN domain-containing protein [Anaerolineae bacterium]|nr:PIN domain-containing protein [Anaerolineae bacterium]
MTDRFLDTNVLLRYFTTDDPKKAQAALSLLTRVERGEEKVETSPLVIFETVFTLQHRYQMPREDIRDALSDLLSLRGLRLSGKSLFAETLTLYARSKLSFTDAYNVVYMKQRQLSEIYSWDTVFERIPGIQRAEP